RFQASAGDVLTITTTTPGDGTGEPVNVLDPVLDLYDPSGTLVATNDNGAGDGRNALVSYTVPAGAGGTYRVVVPAAANTSGECPVAVSGAAAAPAPSLGTTPVPTGGAPLTPPPTSSQVHSPRALLLPPFAASALKVNGIAATAVTVLSPDTLL